ncbi:MAG TPA: hypothetical protein VNG29_02890 [Candidatus Paceibacterota bacterium]|nr:hypothetical protein [Candidatus Paceibacterota bacterium]
MPRIPLAAECASVIFTAGLILLAFKDVLAGIYEKIRYKKKALREMLEQFGERKT